MKCNKCGTNLNEKDKFCFMCGTKVNTQDKTGLILAIIAACMTLITVNTLFIVITVVLSTLSIIFTYIKRAKKYYYLNIGLSIYAILACIIIALFLF